MGKLRISVTINEDVKKQAERLAKNESRSFSSLVEIALKKYIKLQNIEL